MAPPAPLLDRARQCHQAGNFHQAEQLCQQYLNAQPGNAGAWNLLGSSCQAQGKLGEAVAGYRRSLDLQPQALETLMALASALVAQGQREEAVLAYRQVLRLRPDFAEAHTRLGVLLAEASRLDEGVAHLREAIRCRADFAQAHHNLGIALVQQGKPDEAMRSLQEALRLKPDYAEACYNLGIVLASLDKRDEAIASYRQALQLKPDYPDVYNNLGLALVAARRPSEAVVILEHAVRLRPQSPEAHNNLGLALAELGRFAEAERYYRESLRLNPQFADAHVNLASTIKEMARPEEALASYQLGLWIQPDAPSTHWNRSLLWLQEGDYEKGWAEYEWRWRRPKTKPRQFPQPRWDGTPLAGRTLLIWMEQGLGDIVHFIRYASVVKERGGTVLVECPAYLMALLSRCPGIDRLVAERTPLPAFDVHTPLMSLPFLCGTTSLAKVPAAVPYLFVSEERIQIWRQRLAGFNGFKVALVWKGNPHHPVDQHRSAPLTRFAPLAAVRGVRLISLQKDATEHLQAAASQFVVSELEGNWDPLHEAFLDSVAIMKGVDLVVTVDTAIAHIAGALGVPVWVALSTVSDWRWLRDREKTPWYPTMRLFRQKQLGDWESVFERMARELEKLVPKPAHTGIVPVETTLGELIDKITILEIKSVRIADPEKLAHVHAELARLVQARTAGLAESAELTGLTAALKTVNEKLWQIEDEIRLCEKAGDFGSRFVELARSVYRTNDERASLKRQINELAGTPFVEQKAYATYQ